MANWCFTGYTITGEQAELDSIYNLLSGLPDDSEWEGKWMGELARALDKDVESLQCRGALHDLTRNDDRLTFIVESAWSPLYELIDLLCSKYSSVKYYYYAEECGNDFYETNDIEGLYYPNRYKAIIELSAANIDEEGFKTLPEAAAWIASFGDKVKRHDIHPVEIQDLKTVVIPYFDHDGDGTGKLVNIKGEKLGDIKLNFTVNNL